jgi:DNA polymerase-3 subunit alpha
MSGALAQGCPQEDATAIWTMFEMAGSYLFNASHATAYAVTAYVGAYLKVNYPTAFYTVALQWAKDDEIPTLMSEMELCSNAKIVAPDINISGSTFFTDYDNDEIFWSLSRIKMLGIKATDWIVTEREVRGEFTSIENFIERVFRYKLKKYQYWDDPDNPEEATKCPVNARHVRNLIISGCFDKIENAQSVVERYAILEKAACCLGFQINEKDIPTDLRDKHYFWSQQQIALSGIGSIDYKRIFDNSEAKPKIKGKASWALVKQILDPDYDGKRVALCANIVDIEEKKFKDKKTNENKVFCKLLLQQNNDLVELIVWSEEWARTRHIFAPEGSVSYAKNKMIICSAQVKFSEFVDGNNLQLYKSSIVEIL